MLRWRFCALVRGIFMSLNRWCCLLNLIVKILASSGKIVEADAHNYEQSSTLWQDHAFVPNFPELLTIHCGEQWVSSGCTCQLQNTFLSLSRDWSQARITEVLWKHTLSIPHWCLSMIDALSPSVSGMHSSVLSCASMIRSFRLYS
jgi:hypothetical protein